MYRILPTSQRPMLTVEVDSETFTQEWRRCWEDKTYPLDTLIEYARPFITHWKELLLSSGASDINYVSLCARLSPEADDALNQIKRWVDYSTLYSSVEDELWYLFIEHIRKARYFPTFANPVMAEFVIARDYKHKLRVAIQRPRVQSIDNDWPESILEEQILEQPIPDYLFLKNFDVDRWQHYLLLYVLNHRSPYDIAENTHIPYETYKKEERYLWHLLRENFLSKESLVKQP